MTREEAIEKLEAFAPMVVDDTREALDMAIKALEELPKRRKEAKRWKRKALKAEPKHWKWVLGDGYYCSSCGYKLQKTAISRSCPNCGAKMDGGK